MDKLIFGNILITVSMLSIIYGLFKRVNEGVLFNYSYYPEQYIKPTSIEKKLLNNESCSAIPKFTHIIYIITGINLILMAGILLVYIFRLSHDLCEIITIINEVLLFTTILIALFGFCVFYQRERMKCNCFFKLLIRYMSLVSQLTGGIVLTSSIDLIMPLPRECRRFFIIMIFMSLVLCWLFDISPQVIIEKKRLLVCSPEKLEGLLQRNATKHGFSAISDPGNKEFGYTAKCFYKGKKLNAKLNIITTPAEKKTTNNCSQTFYSDILANTYKKITSTECQQINVIFIISDEERLKGFPFTKDINKYVNPDLCIAYFNCHNKRLYFAHEHRKHALYDKVDAEQVFGMTRKDIW